MAIGNTTTLPITPRACRSFGHPISTTASGRPFRCPPTWRWEFIEGRDLRSILAECQERGRTLPVALTLHVASLLASALDYAHKKRDFEDRELGLVHRDVSPQNVLISFDGEVKLCDFGIAKAASKASHTRAGALKGKLQYMSPEQA